MIALQAPTSTEPVLDRFLMLRHIPDPDPENPRSWDSLWYFVFLHKRYQLGDPHDFKTVSELHEYLESDEVLMTHTVYMYEHGTIGFSLSNHQYPFNCPWDSGVIGYAVLTKDRFKSRYGERARLTSKRRQEVLAALESELEVYEHYVTGEVYIAQLIEAVRAERGVEVEVLDSIGGVFPKDNDVLLNYLGEHLTPEMKEWLQKHDRIPCILTQDGEEYDWYDHPDEYLPEWLDEYRRRVSFESFLFHYPGY